MRLGRCLLLALAGFALLAPTAAARQRIVPYRFFGAVYDRELLAAGDGAQRPHWALMARTGVEAVRIPFHWSDAQPRRDSPPSFETTDRVVALAAARRLTVLAVVARTPAWARTAPDKAEAPPARPGPYVAYLRALVDRYGPRGRFWRERRELPKRPIRTWQIENEPQFAGPWRDGEGRPIRWMTGYTRLLKASYRAIKAKDRRATVVLAGSTNRAWDRLAWLYRSGARRYFDVAAIHPFTRRPANVLEAVRRFRAVMRRHGRRERRKPVWVTEMGWSGAKGRVAHIPPFQTWATSDRNVARNLTRAYSLLARNRRRLGLRRVYWYTWASDYRGGGFLSIFEYSGLLRYRDGRSRRMPAWGAYLRSARRYEGCAKNNVGACAR